MAWIISAVGIALLFSYFILHLTLLQNTMLLGMPTVFTFVISLVSISLVIILLRKIVFFFKRVTTDGKNNSEEMEEPLDNVIDQKVYRKELYIHDVN